MLVFRYERGIDQTHNPALSESAQLVDEIERQRSPTETDRDQLHWSVRHWTRPPRGVLTGGFARPDMRTIVGTRLCDVTRQLINAHRSGKDEQVVVARRDLDAV